MRSWIPDAWRPWRAESPLDGRRPGRDDLERVLERAGTCEDVLPYSHDGASAGHVSLLVVGINPSPWTAAVNAPFAHPGNRFWSSLALAGITDGRVDASRGLSRTAERVLAERGIGITNLVTRVTARADQLTRDEVRTGGARLVDRVHVLRPNAVAIVGVTAFREAFASPATQLGQQKTDAVGGWPSSVPLWVLPNPSGLNAHETVPTLGRKWEQVWAPIRTRGIPAAPPHT